MHAVCKHFKPWRTPASWSLTLHRPALVITTFMQAKTVNFKRNDFVKSTLIIPFSGSVMLRLLMRHALQPEIMISMERCQIQYFAKSKQHTGRIFYEWFAFVVHVHPSTTWPCASSIVTSIRLYKLQIARKPQPSLHEAQVKSSGFHP